MPQVEAAVPSATSRGVRSGILGRCGFTVFFLSKQYISNLVRSYYPTHCPCIIMMQDRDLLQLTKRTQCLNVMRDKAMRMSEHLH